MAVMNKLEDRSPVDTNQPWAQQTGVWIKIPLRPTQTALRRKAAAWCKSARRRLKSKTRNWLGCVFFPDLGSRGFASSAPKWQSASPSDKSTGLVSREALWACLQVRRCHRTSLMVRYSSAAPEEATETQAITVTAASAWRWATGSGTRSPLVSSGVGRLLLFAIFLCPRATGVAATTLLDSLPPRPWTPTPRGTTRPIKVKGTAVCAGWRIPQKNERHART